MALGVILLVTAGLEMMHSLGGHPEGERDLEEQKATGGLRSTRIAGFALLMLAWALSLEKVGFLITSTLAGCAISWLLGPRKFFVPLAVGIVGALATYGLFAFLLRMRLP